MVPTTSRGIHTVDRRQRTSAIMFFTGTLTFATRIIRNLKSNAQPVTITNFGGRTARERFQAGASGLTLMRQEHARTPWLREARCTDQYLCDHGSPSKATGTEKS